MLKAIYCTLSVKAERIEQPLWNDSNIALFDGQVLHIHIIGINDKGAA